MYDSIADITALINEKESQQTLLRTRMEDDFDLFSLKDYVPKGPSGKVRKGYESYTSSAPRNFFDKVLDGLGKANMQIQIMMPDDADEEERRRASQGELFIFGALLAVDRNLVKRAEPPLREGLGFLTCLRGWCALRALVYLPKGQTDVHFDVQPWDALHCTWEMGRDGLLWAARKRRATKAQIMGEYAIKINGKEAEVIDFWDEDLNCVIVDNIFAKKPTPHKIGHVPVYIQAVGSMPTVQQKNYLTTIEHRGDSVWSSSRGLYEPQNKYISWVMDLAKKAVAGSLVYYSDDGQKSIESDPFESWTMVKAKYGTEKIEQVPVPGASPEMLAALSIIDKDIQQSSLPYPLAYGGTKEAMSGRALSVLADATRSIYNPRTDALARAYTWLCEELLSQYKVKGMKPVKLQGYKDDTYFSTKVKPSDIDPSWFVSVKVEPRMPRDEIEQIQTALMATGRRGDTQPLMSVQSARETYLDLRDPDAEGDKVMEEMGESMPPIMAANIAASLKRRGKDELAEQVAMLLRPQGAPVNGAPPSPVNSAVSPPLPPQLVELIVKALAQTGQGELAAAFLEALKVSAMPPQPVAAPNGQGGM